jgi:hypothetical protein
MAGPPLAEAALGSAAVSDAGALLGAGDVVAGTRRSPPEHATNSRTAAITRPTRERLLADRWTKR